MYPYKPTDLICQTNLHAHLHNSLLLLIFKWVKSNCLYMNTHKQSKCREYIVLNKANPVSLQTTDCLSHKSFFNCSTYFLLRTANIDIRRRWKMTEWPIYRSFRLTIQVGDLPIIAAVQCTGVLNAWWHRVRQRKPTSVTRSNTCWPSTWHTCRQFVHRAQRSYERVWGAKPAIKLRQLFESAQGWQSYSARGKDCENRIQ